MTKKIKLQKIPHTFQVRDGENVMDMLNRLETYVGGLDGAERCKARLWFTLPSEAEVSVDRLETVEQARERVEREEAVAAAIQARMARLVDASRAYAAQNARAIAESERDVLAFMEERGRLP